MSAAPGHFQSSPPSAGIWYFLNRFLIVLIFCLVLAIAGYRFLPEVARRRSQQTELDRLRAEVDRERQLLARNTRTEESLKHDPEYLETISRDRLDLMKEGETIYRLEPPKPEKARMRLKR